MTEVEAEVIDWKDWDGCYEDDDVVDLAKIIGGGYNAFWHDRHLFRMVKGSKGSKKSKTTALNFIDRLMDYPDANLLVVRRYSNTLVDSCFTDLLWAMGKLKVREYWQVSESRVRMRNPTTGQVILFRGLDDASKLASITVDHGYLCWVWFEEFSEITNEDEFVKLTMSIRGKLPPHLWKQFTCTFNPWSENLWFKAKYFDKPREDTFTLTTTYKDNEFLDDVDRQRYLDLYVENPRMARIVCDGDWGIAEGLIYENFVMEDFSVAEIQARRDLMHVFGLDFGFKVSYNAFVAASVDVLGRRIYVWDEMYERGQDNLELVKTITRMGYAKETIWADSASPLVIHELQEGRDEAITDSDGVTTVIRWSLPNIRGAIKGHDSIMSGISRLQCFQFVVHPKCMNFWHELNNYCYAKDRDGKSLEKPEKDWDHCLVAGTMVLTDHGQVPIEDIQVGDLVMTHLGFMPVEAAGITQLEAEIWRLECEDDTILEGTWNHPVITADGVKYLGCISEGNEVFKWCSMEPQGMLERNPNLSSMMDTIGTDILDLNIGNSECITEPMSEMASSIFTDTSGRNSMDQSPRVVRSITSMETPSTMIYPTSNASLPKSMLQSILGMMSAEPMSEIGCVETPNTKICVGDGIDHQKDMSGMFSMEELSQQRCNSKNILASTVARFSRLNLHTLPSSAQTTVNQLLEGHQESITRSVFVNSVVRGSPLTSTVKPDSVQGNVSIGTDAVLKTIDAVGSHVKPVRVVSMENTGRKETVYDLTVAVAHDFFANGLITSNCMDAIRYACTPLLTTGKGRVCEIKGGVRVERDPDERPVRCRRVVSTI